jgi:DNA phosphorothioation-dependent restriction protein DptH
MITGSSGKGKTQFIKYLACKIRDQGKSLLMVDFKNDYASDGEFLKVAKINCVHVTFDGLPYNPLIPYPVKHPSTGTLHILPGQHIAGVASVLRRTYGLGAQQESALKQAIEAAFVDYGVKATGIQEYSRGMQFPDFSAVGEYLKDANHTAYNRLDPLFTLDLFKDEFRASPFKELIEASTILDLHQVPSDEIKNALAQLVVMSAHAYYNSEQQAGDVRQFLVFDEAHRVIGSDYMLRLVRECRSYGVAVVLSSQYPSDFPGDVTSSMATKLIHGNNAEADKVRDIERILGMQGKEGEVATLGMFEAFLDNRHHVQSRVKTMNYPAYLAWRYIEGRDNVTFGDLASVPGLDPGKLPVAAIARQLEELGLVEVRGDRVIDIFS